MPFSTSRHRCGDPFVQPNYSPRTPAPHPAFAALPPPKLHKPTNSVPTQIQYEPQVTVTSECFHSPAAPVQLQPACPNSHNQEERAGSRLLPPPLNLHDFHSSPSSSSSSHEPPETDPALVQVLWNEVLCSESTYNPPNNLLDFSIMESSISRVLPDEYDPPGFSSEAFPEVLEQYQVTIREDWVVPPNLVGTSFWAWFHEVISAAPAEVVSELESCRVWEDKAEGMTVEAEGLAARLKALVMDRDSALANRHEFVTFQILPRCALPGFAVYNKLQRLGAATETYHLIPTREHPPSGISTQPIAGKSARPTSFRSTSARLTSARPTSSINLPKAVPRRSALQNTAPLTKIDPPTPRELNLPKDTMDYAYWLEASELWPSVGWIMRQTFVSTGTVRKTSPYLSIVFENSDCESFTEQKLLLKHKIAVYGSTALYNRRLLSIKASTVGRNSSSSVPQVKRSACDIHFGLVVIQSEAILYTFQCDEENRREREQDMATAWHGCSMYTVEAWNLTDPKELADMLSYLRIISDWVGRVYVPGLQDDLARLFNNRG